MGDGEGWMAMGRERQEEGMWAKCRWPQTSSKMSK